jgi:futalosine hydrolase
VGPFVTVSNCSGTAARGLELAARFGGLVEGMEGAALAHVATLYGVPWLELRAISNAVEDRDLSRWRLRDAAEAAQRAVRVVVA